MAPLRLANLRVASPCHARWADMVGDERARLCKSCDREVFNLSEMTRDEAEALLATRGLTPCVRFYRRTDGTIMTADCPTGARRSRRLAVVAGGLAAGAALLGPTPALADPIPDEVDAPDAVSDADPAPAPEMAEATDLATTVDPDQPAEPVLTEEWLMGIPEIGYRPPHRPRFEWSSWVRLGAGTESHAPDGVARATTPVRSERDSTLEAALGADLSIGVARHGDLRLGAWTEVRTSSGPVVGGELQLEALPRHLDMFFYDGEGTLVVRAGGNAHTVTAAIAYGYLAPWKLFGPWDGATRYMIGVRLVASATRSLDDPRDWSATAGIEFEPIGAIRYVLGIRSWY